MLLPTLSILKLIATVNALIVAYQANQRWRENHLPSFNYFYKGMFWLAICCAAFVFSPLISNLYLVQGFLMVADLAAFITFAYLTGLVFILLGLEKFYPLTTKIFLGWAVLIFLIEGLFFREALVYIYPTPFANLYGIEWMLNLPLPLRTWFGAVNLVFMAVFGTALVSRVLKFVGTRERKKGILIALAFLALGTSSIEFWFLLPLIGCTFLTELSQGLFCVIGPVLFHLGMRQEIGS